MKTIFYSLFASIFGLLATAPAIAQEKKTVFIFSPDPVAKENLKEDDTLDAKLFKRDLELRPNSNAEFTLYVFNPLPGGEKTFTVELKVGTSTFRSKVKIPAETWVPVTFAKPAAPAPVVVLAPIPAVAGAPKAEPVPPGAALAKNAEGKLSLAMRLLDDKGDALKDTELYTFKSSADVSLLTPSEYVKSSKPKFTTPKKPTDPTTIIAEVESLEKTSGTADLRLAFPMQSTDSQIVIRQGLYERTMPLQRDKGAMNAPIANLRGSLESYGEEVRIHVGVDGIDRAFIYSAKTLGETVAGEAKLIEDMAVRVTAITTLSIQEATAPVKTYSVRVEADNAPKGTRLELWLRPEGTGNAAADNELIPLGGPRDEQVWLDLPGPTGGFFFTSRSKDWIKTIDSQSLRGTMELVGVLKAKDDGKTLAKSQAFRLTVDGTPPDRIVFGKLPAKHIKGTPLPLSVTTSDPETAIRKVVFYLAKENDEGKLPPEAVKLPAERLVVLNKLKTDNWVAAMPLAADKKGEIFVTAQVTNEAGLVSTLTQRIELVDPPVKKPIGSIVGKVQLGERFLPGVDVTLSDADGKLKGNAKTDANGSFKFENLVAGKYSVAASRKDSVSETKGKAEVIVEDIVKPTKATLTMARPK